MEITALSRQPVSGPTVNGCRAPKPLYIAAMEKLDAILARLKDRQRELIMEAAELGILPATSTLRKIAELENVIAAVEAVSAEERDAAGR